MSLYDPVREQLDWMGREHLLGLGSAFHGRCISALRAVLDLHPLYVHTRWGTTEPETICVKCYPAKGCRVRRTVSEHLGVAP